MGNIFKRMENEMPTLQALLKTKIDIVESYDDPNDIFKKVICKAEMALKSNNQERMDRYLAELHGITDPSGIIAEEEAPGDDDAASDE